MFSREQMQRAIEDALKQMEGVALELYRRGREEAREEIETVKRERDEARASCADCAMWAERSARWHDDMQRAERERDEARAEVERLRAEAASFLAMARIAGDKHDQKCAEVDVLRGVGCNVDGDGPCGACRKCAYRHGAEAMREAVDKVVCTKGIWDSSRLSARIEALPIPEEP